MTKVEHNNQDDQQQIAQLLTDLRSNVPEQQLAAVKTCGEQRIAQLFPDLVEVLQSIKDPYYSFPRQLMETTIWALGEIGDRKAVTYLITHIDNVFYKIQVAAMTALGKLEAEEAVEPIRQILNKDFYPQFVHLAAVEALGEIATPAAVAFLQELAKDKKHDTVIKEKAHQMLSYIQGFW
ncbi:MAG: HEAT repeat domain-containing protein [Candidatus Schekmanbacteria bacterium]|nr:HEAT repeat domain-containing protein [Candidatus Schekmanbacteria bacterium]